MMRRGHLAMKNGSWSEVKEKCKKEGKSSQWTLERNRKAYEKVAKAEIGRIGIVQEILKKSTDFLRRVIAPIDGMGEVALSYVCPHCNQFSLGGPHLVGNDGDTEMATTEKRDTAVGGVQHVEANTKDQQDTGGAVRCRCQ